MSAGSLGAPSCPILWSRVARLGEVASRETDIHCEAAYISKPSMRLADAYSQASLVDENIEMNFTLDSDSDSVADARSIVVSLMLDTIDLFAIIIRDDELHQYSQELKGR